MAAEQNNPNFPVIQPAESSNAHEPVSRAEFALMQQKVDNMTTKMETFMDMMSLYLQVDPQINHSIQQSKALAGQNTSYTNVPPMSTIVTSVVIPPLQDLNLNGQVANPNPNLSIGQIPVSNNQNPFILNTASVPPVFTENIVVSEPVLAQSEEAKSLSLKVQLLEDSFRSLQGLSSYPRTRFSDLLLFPNLKYPEKFKMPEFTKYNGVGNPLLHLKIYANDLGSYAANEQLSMQLFQKSLSGSALEWYMKLNPAELRTWDDIATRFMKQYKHNIDNAPDRLELLSVYKKPSESFKDYAQRWRDIAAQVQPPVEESEMVKLFIRAQQEPYYKQLLTMQGRPFSEVISAGSLMEIGIRSGQIEVPENMNFLPSNGKRPMFPKRRENETNMVIANPTPQSRVPYSSKHQQFTYSTSFPPAPNPHPPYMQSYGASPLPCYVNNLQVPNSEPQSFPSQQFYPAQQQIPKKPPRNFTPLPMSRTQLYEALLAQKRISPVEPLQHQDPKYFKPTETCAYHSGMVGHFTERCIHLKHMIQNMIDAKQIVIKGASQPNVTNNPLPNHAQNATGGEK